MLREMMTMNEQQALAWVNERKLEAITACMQGTITEEVCESIERWAVENYIAWYSAWVQGLIGKED